MSHAQGFEAARDFSREDDADSAYVTEKPRCRAAPKYLGRGDQIDFCKRPWAMANLHGTIMQVTIVLGRSI